jgi:tyrosine-protein phosphatase SIW14
MRSWVMEFSVGLLLGGSLSAADLATSGVPNFSQVDEHVYRGGQPSAQGVHALAKLGIKTVVDLRSGAERQGGEASVAGVEGMRYVHVPMAPLSAPTDKQISTVLQVLDDSGSWPVFVHCMRGADRTGAIIACYRMTHDRWTNEQALKEARLFGLSSLQHGIRHYILGFQPGEEIFAPAVSASR